jgi:lipoic acid synthetase
MNDKGNQLTEIYEKKPEWLKKTWKMTDEIREVEDLIETLGLNTVCREASCPNYADCFGRGTATFMILGAVCTRNCGFCDVRCDTPEKVDPGEPARIAEAIKILGLNYVVITSVTRDDLEDGGAAQFAETVSQIKKLNPKTKIETLIPDFGGSEEALTLVLEAAPDVISHNIETVRALYDKVRPQADYDRSLEVIRRIGERGRPGIKESPLSVTRTPMGQIRDNPDSESGKEIKAKSGFMVGVGETNEQVLELMDDLRSVGCNILTIGQYLRPSKENIPVEKFIEPEVFDRWADEARKKGFEFVASAPFVRSSYHAEEALIDKQVEVALVDKQVDDQVEDAFVDDQTEAVNP